MTNVFKELEKKDTNNGYYLKRHVKEVISLCREEISKVGEGTICSCCTRWQKKIDEILGEKQ